MRAHELAIEVDGKGLISKKSERYKAAEAVARRSHRLILMTATPHSRRDYSLWALLRLLDPDAWGDRCPRKIDVPSQQFRKVSKEIMRDVSGDKLFKDRHPQRVEYEIVWMSWSSMTRSPTLSRRSFGRSAVIGPRGPLGSR